MVRGYYLDKHPKANVAEEHYAYVKLPSLKRDRVPAANVTIVESKQQALQQANTRGKIYPAKVIGPARSSEGFNIFYIVEIYN